MFNQARTKLTIYYVSIIAIGMIIFSVVFYSYSVRDVTHDVSHDAEISLQARSNLINSTLSELERTIVIGNLIILFVLGFLCYWLAGKTLKPIKAALDSQERFSSNASHELRTPLAIMKLENELFLQESSPTMASAQLLATSNLEEISRMTDMVQSLLILARSKTLQTTMERKPVDLSQIITNSANRIKKLFVSKSIKLSLKIEPEIFIAGDQKLIEQVFINIIQNAFSYTDIGLIAITAHQTLEAVTVTITDSGIGINPADLTRITEPFFKATQSRTRTSNGVGLGLAIVHEIIRLHNGNLSIQSTLGQGTTVTITLPKII